MKENNSTEHEKINEMIQKKISDLQKNNDTITSEKIKADIARLKKVGNLLSNSNFGFLQKVNIDVAFAILTDIGVPKESLKDLDKKLLKEEIGRKYTLVDIDRLEGAIEEKKKLTI